MIQFRSVPVADFATPRLWNVCFTGTERHRWFDRFLRSGFRHVYLVGYVPEFGVWLKYEVLFAYTTLAIVSGDHVAGLFAAAMRDGDVVAVAPQFHVKHNPVVYLGFWCAPAVRHALGLRCVAITPQGLHRYLLKMGAKSLRAETHEPVQRTEDQARCGGPSGPSPAASHC